jgi:von Willebrand factor type A domain
MGSSEPQHSVRPLNPGESSGGPAGDDATALASGGEVTSSGVDFGLSDEPGSAPVCASHSAASELRRVYLAFAFDVSASMGGDNQTRYETKWLPVVAASEAFFAEPESAAISASLTFFPAASQDVRCTDAAYQMPDVPQTPLPSPAFADAIGGLRYSLGSNTWRSSTPSLAAFNGTAASLLATTDASPGVTRAVVFVTDGVPQGCNGANDVQLVADAVRNSGVTTFVVGVANPPGDNSGDNLANLDVIAAAGGTERAFIVATGDPTQTEADFKTVIDRIRGSALPCNMEIPLPPAGSTFIPDQVSVTYGTADGQEVALDYDADCALPGSWRYDDPVDPATIELCGDVCGQVRRDASARLTIEFACESRIQLR